MDKDKKYYTVKKYVVEEYEVLAASAEEARKTELTDPHTVTIQKVTAKAQ